MKTKKILTITLALSMIPNIIMAKGISLQFDGIEKNPPAEMGESYINKDSRTMVPVRYISEALGNKVEWDNEKREVKINDKQIIIPIGKDEILVNNQKQKMDTKAEIKDGRTYVPLRFVAEALGQKVDYNQGTKSVILKSKDYQERNQNQIGKDLPNDIETDEQYKGNPGNIKVNGNIDPSTNKNMYEMEIGNNHENRYNTTIKLVEGGIPSNIDTKLKFWTGHVQASPSIHLYAENFGQLANGYDVGYRTYFTENNGPIKDFNRHSLKNDAGILNDFTKDLRKYTDKGGKSHAQVELIDISGSSATWFTKPGTTTPIIDRKEYNKLAGQRCQLNIELFFYTPGTNNIVQKAVYQVDSDLIQEVDPSQARPEDVDAIRDKYLNRNK